LMPELIEDIGQSALDLAGAVENLIAAQGSLPKEALSWSSDTTDKLTSLSSKAGTIADLAMKVADQRPDDFFLVPTTRLAALRDSLRTLNAQANSVATTFAPLKASSNEAVFDRSGGIIIFPSGDQFSLNGLLTPLHNAVDQVLEAYFPVSSATSPRALGTFSAASRILTAQATEAVHQVKVMTDDWSKWTTTISHTQDQIEQIETASVEGQRLLSEIEKSRKTIEENEQRTAAAALRVETVRVESAELQTQVKDYSAQFEAFKKQLDARSSALAEGNTELSSLMAAINSENGKVVSLISQAEEMLGGATNAGLSSAYNDKTDNIDKQLEGSRYTYYGSIAFLVVSVAAALNLLNFAYITLPVLPKFSDATPTGNIAVQVFAALGSRALLMLPALLLAGFAAHRHTTLFRLREEYGHKYTIAASVNGFKLQAPSFQEQIAAAVFTELLTNPANTMDSNQPAVAPNGFINKLIQPSIVEALKKAGLIPDLK
jgi:predicted  nucleic acid-binding Zn-ribbon protein